MKKKTKRKKEVVQKGGPETRNILCNLSSTTEIIAKFTLQYLPLFLDLCGYFFILILEKVYDLTFVIVEKVYFFLVFIIEKVYLYSRNI